MRQLTITWLTISSVTSPSVIANVKVPSIHRMFITCAVVWLISPITITPAEGYQKPLLQVRILSSVEPHGCYLKQASKAQLLSEKAPSVAQ